MRDGILRPSVEASTRTMRKQVKVEFLHTFGNARDSLIFVAVCFLKCKKNVGLGPIREHFADHSRLVAVLFAKLGKVTLVLECTERIVLVI